MAVYKAPLRDMRFVFADLLGAGSVSALPGCEDVTADLVSAVLEEAAKVCEEVLFPLNRSGDEEGCTFENGAVRTPDGFRAAYDTFRDGGWVGMACAPEHGGQGLPNVVTSLVQEMICSANMSFGMYPGLSQAAYKAIRRFGSPEQKALYLPKLAAGVWSGTMCLTEPQCGTDLGLIRTKAEPGARDGAWSLTGTKIFISAGEHDLAENIVHLVLARLPDAPPGTKGLSLFVVPKILPTPDGSPGARNGVACTGIEHKMGIKASSTCVMTFDGATGWLVGAPHNGMRAMFTMMNAARLGVGIQGLGIMEAAYQGAVAYARERLQGRALTGPKAPDQTADPILVHPDVRRMLLTMRAYTEGGRMLAGWVSRELDDAERAPDAERRQAADDFVALMTPIVKAFLTDLGSEVANLGVQVYGGHGYIREWGMEQYVRDARIAQIYEGTNGIQALDLVGRKLPAHTGRSLRRFFHPVAAFLERATADPDLAPLAMPVAKQFGRLQRATAHIARTGQGNPDEAGAAATDFLRLFGLVAMGYLWLRAADVSRHRLDGKDAAFHKAKLDTARFFVERLLPQCGALFAAIMSGSRTMMAFDDAAF